MVGNCMLNVLREDFGAVSIIAIGDLFQLQPVMDGYIYKDVENSEYCGLCNKLVATF